MTSFVSAEEVARLLPYEECIPLMREAMIALSQGRTRQLLRGDHRPARGPRLRRDARRDARRRRVRRQAGQRLSREFRQGRPARTRAWSSCSIRRPARRRRCSTPARSPRSAPPPPRPPPPTCWRGPTPAGSPSSAMASRPGGMSRRSACVRDLEQVDDLGPLARTGARHSPPRARQRAGRRARRRASRRPSTAPTSSAR